MKKKTTKNQLLANEKELLGFYVTGHPMDDYKSILKKLSCLPFSKIHNLDDNTVFRTAFIINTVRIRVAAKTQKKFAILEISDGIEKFELSIWSDLYEEKSYLLIENQLLYAVLLKEDRNGEIRLSGKCLEDLTQINSQIIKLCDQTYDKAKWQLSKFSNNNQKVERLKNQKQNT